jgi:hypothetical protein
MEQIDNDQAPQDIKEADSTVRIERPRVRGTAVGGQYISPSELFTTKAGRQAIRNLIKTVELDKSRPERI